VQPGAPSDNDTLVDVLREFAARGYGDDFGVAPGGQLRCAHCDATFPASSVEVVALRRLEGASDPDDMVAVVAVSCPHCDGRGSVVLGYGPNASADDSDVLAALPEGDHPAAPPATD
jgi:hypothetical protein